MSKYFDNKVIWVTGASSGIGEALVKKLAHYPCKLILSARREEELKRVALEANLSEEDHLILPLDLEQIYQMDEKVNLVLKQYGQIDILINNAGLSQRSFVLETEIEVYEKLMKVDYLGTIALTKSVLPHMVGNNTGHIVSVTSVMGIYSSPRRSGYCGAKHAVHGFMNSLRAEVYDNNIDVTIIAPGYVHTNISINAVSGDGSSTGVMDEATKSGLDPDSFAEKMLNAVSKRTPEKIIAGPKEKSGAFLYHFFPGLLRKVIRQVSVT